MVALIAESTGAFLLKRQRVGGFPAVGRFPRRGPRYASSVSLFRKELEIALYFDSRASFV